MRPVLTAIGFLALLSCNKDEPNRDKGPEPAGAEPAAVAPEPVLRKLTESQYANSITALFSDELVMPTQLEPDIEADGLLQIGSAENAISPLGVEQYEAAALSIAEQAMEPGPLRNALVPCTPTGDSDAACARTVLEPFARRAWRRPLTSDELDTLVDIAGTSGETLADFYDGLELAFAAVLQSPYFLYRVELGEPDPTDPGTTRYTDWEMASRLSYFLWNTTPDDALLEAAENGELTDPTLLAGHVDRMLDDPRAREGFANFVDEMLALRHLIDLSKDPTIFPAMRSDVGSSARTETLMGIESLVFDRDDDFRSWLTTRQTYLNPTLAMLYAVPAPDRDGFAAATLPADGPRRGLLGQASILTHYAHPVSTSATKRGVFVRDILLCQPIPPPPADVDTSIPEPSADAPTRRERVDAHLENEFCAGCHNLTDPIGLGLENFDGLGIYRELENGAVIDASGDLDGDAYKDAWGLAQAVHDAPAFPLCMADTVFAYANGHRPGLGEQDWVEWANVRFAEEHYSMLSLLREIALSRAFRTTTAVGGAR